LALFPPKTTKGVELIPGYRIPILHFLGFRLSLKNR